MKAALIICVTIPDKTIKKNSSSFQIEAKFD